MNPNQPIDILGKHWSNPSKGDWTIRFDLTDEEWVIIEPLLPRRIRGPGRVDDRKVLNRIFYILRTGAPWRDLPECYGPRTVNGGAILGHSSDGIMRARAA